MSDIKLYDLELSGHCYKVRLFLSLLGKSYERISCDFLAGEHKSAAYLAMNPFGEIPILVDGECTLRDSQAILIYLARKYGDETWLPTEAGAMAQVAEWLMVAENEISRGPYDARLHDKFGYQLDVGLARDRAKRILGILEARLAQRRWLVHEQPTIADIACFPCIALGHEGGVPTSGFPAVTAWVNRIKALPNFIGMPAI